MKKTVILFTFVLFLSLTVNAQWYKLHAYNNPFATDSCNFTACPVLSEIAGNGVILYGAETGTNTGKPGCLIGGGGENIMLSKDDLDTCTAGISAGGLGPGNIVTIDSKNDSCHFVIYTNGGVGTFLEYTTDNFKTTAVFNAANLKTPIQAYFYNTIPAGFSNSFIFFVRDIGYYPSPNTDTLIVYRANDSLTSIIEFKNTKYIAPYKPYFTSDSIGYMRCIYSNDSSKSVLLKTADSGKTWTDCFLDSVHTITDFYFPTANIGYLTESNGAVYKTTNTGTNWTKLVSPTSIQLNCVSFANDSVGYIGGNSGVLYKTTTGGKTWANANSGTTNTIVALYTFGDSIAYFKDAGNSLYKNVSPLGIETLNGGNNVIDIYPNPSNGKFSVAIKNYELGITNSIEVYNMLGEKITPSFVIRNSQFVIDLSNQPNGIYFYQITGVSGSPAINGKLILTK